MKRKSAPNGHKPIKTLADLTPDAKNARAHSPRNVGLIETALGEVGAARSIVIDEKGTVLAGNATVEAAARAGIERVKVVEADGNEIVAVRRTGLTKRQKTRLALLDNAPNAPEANETYWEAEVIAQLAAQERALLDGILRDDELAALIGQNGAAPEDPGPQIDRAAELQKQWGTATGQLWQIGAHRLICGDCTDRAVVERVMGGEKARVVVTSPPYADQRDYELGEFDWQALMEGCTDQIFPICGKPADVLINLGLSHKGGVNRYWEPWLDYCASIGHPVYGWYVWDKLGSVPGDWSGRLSPAHEWVFHFGNHRTQVNKWIEAESYQESRKRAERVGARHTRFRQKDGTLKGATSPDKIGQPFKIPESVIRIRAEKARGVHTEGHPAVYPPELPEFVMNTWGSVDDVVYDPFCGSGTTLVACERTGRCGRGVEISPAYVAVALQRLADMGLTPELVDDAKATRKAR